MGSESIRRLIDQEEPSSEFTISGPGKGKEHPVKERIKLVFKRLDLDTDEESKKELERVLEAHDLYTKKSRFSQTVQYLDKKTNKTVFVDTGKSIALNRNGITESGVKLALQMAQQRFGSTLTINGSAEFKRLVIEAAAKNNLDIHFTDKVMNDRLAERRAELELERDSDHIVAPDAAVIEPVERSTSAQQPEGEGAIPSGVTKGSLLDHGSAPYMMDKKNDDSYYVAVKTSSGIRTLWGVGLAELMKDGGYQQGQPIQITDRGSVPVVKMVKNKDTGARESKEVFRRVWEIDPAPVRDRQTPNSTSSAIQPSASATSTAQPATSLTSVTPSEAATKSVEPKPLRIPGLSADAESRKVQIVEPPAFVPTLVTEEGAVESFLIARELTFRESMNGLTEAEIQSSSTMMEWRGSDHATWLLASADDSPAGRNFLASYMKDEFYRDSFIKTIDAALEEPGLSPEALAAFDPALVIAADLVKTARDTPEVVTSEVSTVLPAASLNPAIDSAASPVKPGKAAKTTGSVKPPKVKQPAAKKPAASSKDKTVATGATSEPREVEKIVAVIEEVQELEIDN